MTKPGTVKSNVQFIHTPGGDDLAVLPRIEYDRLVALATEAQEDVSASRIVRSSTRALKEGREVVLPKAVADRLANGDNAVRVIREWRDMIQGELAVAVGISQNYLSEIETGRRKGPAELQKKFARAMGVPVDLLIESQQTSNGVSRRFGGVTKGTIRILMMASTGSAIAQCGTPPKSA